MQWGCSVVHVHAVLFFLSHTPSRINRWLVCCINSVHKPKKQKTEDILFYRCKQLVNKVSLSMQYCNAILTCGFCLCFLSLRCCISDLQYAWDVITQSFLPSGWAAKHLFYRAPNKRLHFKSDAVSWGELTCSRLVIHFLFCPRPVKVFRQHLLFSFCITPLLIHDFIL